MDGIDPEHTANVLKAYLDRKSLNDTVQYKQKKLAHPGTDVNITKAV